MQEWWLIKLLENKLKNTQKPMKRAMQGIILKDRKRSTLMQEQIKIIDTEFIKWQNMEVDRAYSKKKG